MALVGDDCFFFLNAGCVRGSQCTFRHQPAARSTTIVCPQWLQRCCFRTNCIFRHTDDVVNRHQTPCYFESNMGVCLKPRCAFGHLRKSNGLIPMPTPVLPAMPPVLPAMPPVLPAMPPVLPVSASVGISSVPPPGPPALNLPLPNNTPVIREAPVTVEKPVTSVSNGNTNAIPQAVVPPLTPPPALPPPPKLTQMLMGSRAQLQLVPTVKDAVSPHAEPHPPLRGNEATTAPSPQNVSILGAAPTAVFPKNEHFNEQVRLFKQMLAAKIGIPSQKKYKDDEYSDDEKSGGAYKVKERQRSKKERKEKEGYKSHKSNKASKEVWSKADEEILYGDYKDVPLDKKSKRKKHKEHKERADSDPEIKIKSYEEILREKALRKLYSKRKEKFNEDFKELVNENIFRKEEIPDKTNKKNDFIPDQVIHKNKKYNSDGDEVEYFDGSKQDVENYKRRHSKSEDYETSKETKKQEEKRNRKQDDEDIEYQLKNDIHDLMLKKAIMDCESRQQKYSKQASKRRKHRDRIEDDEVTDNYDLIEVNSSNGSHKEENDKTESSTEKEDTEEDSSEDDDSDETDSETDSESSEDEVESKKEEIIIPDETTNIDFTVDHDDELAMEINQNEQTEISTKTKKMSSVVSIINKLPINASSSDKSKYHKKSMEREVGTESKSSNARYHKTSDAKSTDRDYNKSSDSKKSNDREHRRKSPKDSISNKHEKPVENKKVVRLVNTCEQPIVPGRVSPSLNSIKDPNATDNDKVASPIKSSIVKVKTFEEIMAEKHKRNNRHSLTLITDSPDVVSIADSPVVAKSLNATLKEKSIRAKLEILNVPKNQNGSAVASVAGDAKSSSSKSKVLSDEEKQKRKSLQLYKPPHPGKVEHMTSGVNKSTEVKMIVNTGSRKIIRIRKASLSTDLIDQSATGENTEAALVNNRNDDSVTVNVRSFDEIIREKRLRQKKEREFAKQMEKENASSNETFVTFSTNSLLRRKPVLRRQVPPIISTIATSICSLSKTLTTVAAILSNTTTTTNNTDSQHVHLNTVSESNRPIYMDSNIAKVLPSKVGQPKRLKSDSSSAPVVTQAESLENKDFYSKLRSFSTRRTSATSLNNTVNECERSQPVTRLRKRSISNTVESSPVSSNHVTNHKITCSFDTSVQSNTSNETKVECHGSSRKDIQEALDEERRKKEQDLLSDDEFEKEINELGSDDDDEDFDDINEDDLMMELEQMIDG